MIGVCGTALVSILGIIGNCIIEYNRLKHDRRRHISTVRFNREFEIYQQLCEKHLTMVYDVGAAVMITRGAHLPDGCDTFKDFCTLAATHVNDADIENKRSAPFISKEIFDEYKSLEQIAFSAIAMFDMWRRFDDEGIVSAKYKDKILTKELACKELEEQQKEVSRCSDLILEIIRKHLERENKK